MKDKKDMDLIVLSGMFPRKCFPYSGTFVYEQVKALRKSINGKITVIVPVPWSPPLLWYKKKWREYGRTERKDVVDNISIYYKRHLVLPGRMFFPFEGLFIYLAVKSLVKKLIKSNERMTIMHTHAVLPSGLAGVLLAKKFKIPHICTIHGSDVNIYPYFSKLSFLLTKYALKRCAHIVAVSNKLKGKTLCIEEGLNNISVIHNGADSGQFFPIPKETAKERLGINENRKIILFIGNLNPVKGVNYLIEAFNLFLRDTRENNVVLFLIGDGEEREKLTFLARSLRIEEKVFILGRKPHGEIPLWLNIADIFVLPSVSEGFPTIIPEALMCGVPVIASDVGGISEIIINGETGLLCKAGDIGSIKNGMKILMYDESLRKKIIIACKEKSKTFTWNNNALSSLAVYGRFHDESEVG